MAANLVLCGGTGAHVGAAFLRLHTLGSPFGLFFNQPNHIELPRLFCIDQDLNNDGAVQSTAWANLFTLLRQHQLIPNPMILLFRQRYPDSAIAHRSLSPPA